MCIYIIYIYIYIHIYIYIYQLHKKYVVVPINKAANNIALISKKYYVTIILKEIRILDAGNETYEKIT